MEYLTAKQIIGRLKQGRVTDISEAYFSQRVRDGCIPYHTLPGKKRKLYLYDEVKQSLADTQDPTRDAQREANALAKENKKLNNDLNTQTTPNPTIIKEVRELNAKYSSAKELINIGFSELDIHCLYKGDDLEEMEQILNKTQHTNNILITLISKQMEFFKVQFGFEYETIKVINFEIFKLSIEELVTVDQFLEYADLDKLKEREVQENE